MTQIYKSVDVVRRRFFKEPFVDTMEVIDLES